MSVFKRCRQRFNSIVSIVMLLLVTVTIWSSAVVPSATADSVSVGSQKAAAILRERAADEFERMGASAAGDIVGDLLESAAENSPELDGSQVKDAARKVSNKVERDIRRTQKGASELGDTIENAAEDAADAVKDVLD